MGKTLDLESIYDGLTDLQRETLALIGDGYSSKLIARELDISASAANERIRVLRTKFGEVSKDELGRIYRKYLDNGLPENLGGQFSQLPPDAPVPPSDGWHRDESVFSLSDSAPVFRLDAPWAGKTEPHVVPEVLDGDHASTFRWVAIVGIAAGMLVVAVLVLAVSDAIGRYFG